MKIPQHKILLFLFLTLSFISFSQEKEISPWSLGAGISNYYVAGDLKSKNLNFGSYIYANRMLSPAFGFELKLFQNKTSAESQNLSEAYPVLYTNQNANDLYFTGNTRGLEFNLLINFNGFDTNKKLTFGATAGIGYQAYQAKLYNATSNELLLNFPAKNTFTKSIFYGIGVRAKYQISKRFDIEFRQNINYNNEDHLDATISNKQKTEVFFVTQLGLSYKLFRKKQLKKIKKDNTEIKLKIITKKTFKDSDNDGVIDRFDQEPNTEKGALVYANGVTIDSDKDGIPDHKDKCPLVFGKNKNGCNDNTIKTTSKAKKTTIKEVKKDTILIKKEVELKKITPKIPKKKVVTKEKVIPKKKENTTKKSITKVVEKPIKKEIKIISKKETILTSNKKSKTKDPEYLREKLLIDDIIKKAKKGKEPKKTIIKYPKNKAEVVKRYKRNPNFSEVKKLNKNNIHYNVFELDNSVNLDQIPISPVYIGCENKATEFDRKNCLYTKISAFSIDNFNKNNIKSKLPKGFYTIRALIVIDDLGKAKVLKTIGDWNKDVIKEVKRVVNSLPLFKPGLLNNIPTPVKLSIKIPFEVE